MHSVDIAGHTITQAGRCFLIAEVGVNHNGDMQTAYQLIDQANEIGVDAVKFQSFLAEQLVSENSPKADYQKQTTQAGESQYHMLKRLELSADQQKELALYCQQKEVLFLSTPYDEASLNHLLEIGVPAIKISSTDLTNLPYLHVVASTQKPILLSTGMSTLGEIEDAVNTIRSTGNQDMILLHCTSDYPAPIEEANLRAIETLHQAFACPVGFSDHTSGLGASPWAVVLGACVVEKHFTLDRTLQGPDHNASLEPDEFKKLVKTIRTIETALGDGIKRITPSESKNKIKVQKSIWAAKDIPKGKPIETSDLACKRPMQGLEPKEWFNIVGKKAACNIQRDQPITRKSIEWE